MENITMDSETLIPSFVHSKLIAECFNKLEKVELYGLKLNIEQVEYLFEMMAGKTKLKHLKIACYNISTINPETLVRCLKKLQTVEFCGSGLNNQKAVEYFRVMNRETEFEELSIRGNSLAQDDPETLTDCIVKLPDGDFTEVLQRIPRLWELTVVKQGEGFQSWRFIITPQ